MIVCLCHRVSDRDIVRAAHGGCCSFEELQFELGVATGCGACLECAQSTFSQHCQRTPAPCHAWPAQAGEGRTGHAVVMMAQAG